MPPRIPAVTTALALPPTPAQPYICRQCLHHAVRRQPSSSTPPRPRGAVRAVASHETQRCPPARADAATRPRAAAKRVDGRSRAACRRSYAHNASLASSAAINRPTTVPPAYRALHHRLIALQASASGHVDLARLQLATRSLESEDVTARIAFLGLGEEGMKAARRLARVLLADALADEEGWEGQVVGGEGDARGLLLRYGDAEDPVEHNPLVRTVNVPSPYLRRWGVEILVSGLNVGGAAEGGSKTLRDAVLVPSLTTPNSAGGRVGFVRYPVHKAVLVAEGVEGAVRFGRLPEDLVDGTLVEKAFSVPSREGQESTGSVDIDLAEHALDLFRASRANGAQFSQEWQRSRISDIGRWVAGANVDTTTPPTLNPAVANLISSVLSDTTSSITLAETTSQTAITSATVPDSERQLLQTTITNWAAESHRDLQTNLDLAFVDSPSWRRTAWFRLFWRIDDVTISASDILHRSWLTESEQLLAFVSGCIAEAGLATREQLRSSTPELLGAENEAVMARHEELKKKKKQKETVAELIQLPSMLAKMHETSGVNPRFAPPWPQTISLTRQYMLQTLVPSFHRKAQSLLLTAVSTIGGSAALSGWFWLATGGVGLYESGAIFALGSVWGLRRLQKRWSWERDAFAAVVREDARRVLGEVEGHLRRLVREGGRKVVEGEDERGWREARGAVYQCQQALEGIITKKT